MRQNAATAHPQPADNADGGFSLGHPLQRGWPLPYRQASHGAVFSFSSFASMGALYHGTGGRDKWLAAT